MGLNELRAFLAKFVLCDKEPIGYFDRYDFEDALKAGTKMETMVIAPAPLGYLCCPLHAPATKEPA